MLTGELRSQVDAIWNAFWSGGITCRSALAKLNALFGTLQHRAFQGEM
jgi:hypothetical protein